MKKHWLSNEYKLYVAMMVVAAGIVLYAIAVQHKKPENGPLPDTPPAGSINAVAEPKASGAEAALTQRREQKNAVTSCTDYEKIDSSKCTRVEVYAAEKQFAKSHTKWKYFESPSHGGGKTPNQTILLYSINDVIFSDTDLSDYRKANISVIQGDGYQFVSISVSGPFHDEKLRCAEVDCPISVRFDQGPLKHYSGRSSNGSSISMVDPSDFLEEIRRSQRAYIVYPTEKLGDVVFEFDVEGFKW